MKTLIFHKQTPKSYTNTELELKTGSCQHYYIYDSGITGQFYCSLHQSVGQISDTHVLIEIINSTWKFNQYRLINLNNAAVVGDLSVPKLHLSNSKTSVEIIHQDTYSWEVMKAKSGHSFFTGKTWSSFSARLFNQKEEATFEWNYEDELHFRQRLIELPVVGNANLSNPKNHFLLFVGMFLMEMELQMKATD